MARNVIIYYDGFVHELDGSYQADEVRKSVDLYRKDGGWVTVKLNNPSVPVKLWIERGIPIAITGPN